MTSFNEKRIWSLWELLKIIENGQFLSLVNTISVNSSLLSDVEHPDYDFLRPNIIEQVKVLIVFLKEIDLPVSLLKAKDLIELLNTGTNISNKGMQKEIFVFFDIIEKEMSAKRFFLVENNRVEFYDKANNLFGDEVVNKYPNAIDDIEGAGRCLALGEGTACVMHLMRVMESGLKSLSSSLGITYAPSWDSHLKQIERNISLNHKNKSIEWKNNEKIYRDLSGDLLTIKQAWRNPTMHVGRKYSSDEAYEIYTAVRNFMKKITTELPKTNEAPQVVKLPL